MMPPADLLAAAFAAHRRDKRDWFRYYEALMLKSFDHLVFAKNAVESAPVAEVFDAATGGSLGWFPVAPYYCVELVELGPFSVRP